MNNLKEETRQWVIRNYKNAHHLIKAEEWLLQLNSQAADSLILATLTHDMDRAFPGPDSPKTDLSSGAVDPLYYRAHAERSARIVSIFLREQGATETLIAEVASLIHAHEEGGWLEADLVQAADSLSFLEVNVDVFLQLILLPTTDWTPDLVRAKFDWMYKRIKIPEARILAKPFYEAAIQKVNRLI